MQESVSLSDIDGQILDFIIPPQQISPGLRVEDLVGRDAYEFIHPDDRERVRTEAHELLRRGQPALFSWRVRTADGSYLWVESQSTPIFDDAGQPKQIVCVTRDISARKQVEAEAERLRQRLWQAEKYQSSRRLCRQPGPRPEQRPDQHPGL
jgi:PAS domain S-box-containing protein